MTSTTARRAGVGRVLFLAWLSLLLLLLLLLLMLQLLLLLLPPLPGVEVCHHQSHHHA